MSKTIGPVWVLVIEHKHGANHYAHRTEAGARATLAEYVAEWWDDWNGLDERPEDPEEAIKLYFEAQESEWYTMEEVVLGE